MIQVRQQLTKKEKPIIKSIIDEIFDSYREFYLTKERLRLFIKENLHLLFQSLEAGNKIIYDEELGIILVTGFADKNFPRKYIKILAKDNNSADKLLKVLIWNFNLDLFIKIKKQNPLKEVLEKNNFRIKADRGSEWLMIRKKKFIKSTPTKEQ